MAMNKVVFSHGQESGPWGTKIQAMADVAKSSGWSVESIDYQGMGDPMERADKLIDWCEKQGQPVVMVGSSMGGFVANAAACRIGARGLFLLAPAFYLAGHEDNLPDHPSCPVLIVHGWRDDVVPWQGSVRYGSESGASVMLMDGDHRLTANIDAISQLFAEFLDTIKRTG
jgi:alpha-beta hydrolase superfamily lysophospholipase